MVGLDPVLSAALFLLGLGVVVQTVRRLVKIFRKPAAETLCLANGECNHKFFDEDGGLLQVTAGVLHAGGMFGYVRDGVCDLCGFVRLDRTLKWQREELENAERVQRIKAAKSGNPLPLKPVAGAGSISIAASTGGELSEPKGE